MNTFKISLVLLAALIVGGCSITAKAPDQPIETQSLAQRLTSAPNQYQAQRTDLPRELRQGLREVFALKQQGELAKAQTALGKLSEAYGQYSEVWLVSGELQAEPEKALADFQRAIAANPHNYLAHNRAATLLRQQGEFAQALAHYNSALDAWPGFALGYMNRGILQDLYLGDKAAALADYQTYQQLAAHAQQDTAQVSAWIQDLNLQIAQTQVARHVP